MFKEEAGAELDAGELEAPCGHQLGLAPPRKDEGFIVDNVLMKITNLKSSLKTEQLSKSQRGSPCQALGIPQHHLLFPGHAAQRLQKVLCGSWFEFWKEKTPVYLCIAFPSLHSAHYSLDLMDSVRHCAPNLIFVWNLGTELFTLCHNL